MPTKLCIQMHLEGSDEPKPEHLRAFGSSVFERGLAGDHNRSAKAYSVGRFASPEPGLWQLDLAVADDRLAAVACSRLSQDTRVFLGPLRGTIADDATVSEQRTWDELNTSVPISAARFSFETPVHFRSSRRKITQPEPMLIFRHLRDRWRCWAPDSAPTIDFKDVTWSIRLEGKPIISTGPGRYDPDDARRVANRITVWTGAATVTIDQATDADRHSLGALAQASPFLGIGANTTAGFGATRVTLVPVDD